MPFNFIGFMALWSREDYKKRRKLNTSASSPDVLRALRSLPSVALSSRRTGKRESMTSEIKLEMIVSGGQTGVDRVALDFGIEMNITIGGWCPKGRKSVSGPIPDRYPLIETESEGYFERTLRNVIDSDGTLILNKGKLAGGTRNTFYLAKSNNKPCLLINLDDDSLEASNKIIAWLAEFEIRKVNIAGPRDSKLTGIYDMALELLRKVFTN
jgi:hypothetical protein